MSFGAGAVLTALLDHARNLGGFERARVGEFKAAPGPGLSFAVWAGTLGSSPEGSGLATTTGLFQASARLYYPMVGREDDVAPAAEVLMTDAADGYLGRLNGDLTLGGLVRDVDVLGMDGVVLEWQFGYTTIDNTLHRIADLPVRAVKNDAWTQA